MRNLSNDDLFFVTEEGNLVGHDNFQRRFQKALEPWGGKAIRFHDLRHTTATLVISSRIDLRTVQELLGHANLSTTQIYTHINKDLLREAVKQNPLNDEAEE